jgi:hypothetical protein
MGQDYIVVTCKKCKSLVCVLIHEGIKPDSFKCGVTYTSNPSFFFRFFPSLNRIYGCGEINNF